jgi:alkylation response protein AidB-like acyl-CoA dehydrogenase
VDFSYSEEQQMLQESVQKFVMQKYDFYTRDDIIKSEAGYSAENWTMFAELGWLTVPFTEEDGGFGGNAVDLMVMMEEFGKACWSSLTSPVPVMGGTLIADLGNEEQKGRADSADHGRCDDYGSSLRGAGQPLQSAQCKDHGYSRRR